MLYSLERGNTCQIFIRRRGAEIPLSVAWRSRCQHKALLDLNWEFGLVMDDKRMEEARAQADFQQSCPFRISPYLDIINDARAIGVAPAAHLLRDVRISISCPIGRGSATKLPRPARRTTTPADCSSRNARFAVMRETLNVSTSSASDGVWSPGFRRPSRMSSKMLSLIAT